MGSGIVTKTTWWAYVQRGMVAKNWNQAELADNAGVNRAAPSTWKNGAGVDPAAARAVAHALGTSVAEAFVAAGFATAEELGVTEVAPNPDLLTNDQLIDQVRRRLRADTERIAPPQPAKRTRTYNKAG